jgi:simple sugar transport system permease protein
MSNAKWLLRAGIIDVASLRRDAWLPGLAGSLAALAVTVLLFSILLLVAGRNPFSTLWALFQGAFGTSFGIRETLTRCTPLMFCALAVAVPARAGLFNIGGEGQLHFGAIATTALVLHGGSSLGVTTVPAMVLVACVAGACWALVPALLKAMLNVNEVLVSLMLNYVAILLVEHLVHGPWKDPSALGWPYSASFPQAAILPTWGNTNVHMGLLLAVVAAVCLWFVMARTTFGFSVKVMEANPVAAISVGIRMQSYLLVTMAIGGALAALAGLGEVSVIQGRLRPGISPGYGYIGFLISWLAGHRFLVVIPAAVVIGGLYSGSDQLQLAAGLPSSTVDIMLGLVFVGVLLGHPIRRWLELRQLGAENR